MNGYQIAALLVGLVPVAAFTLASGRGAGPMLLAFASAPACAVLALASLVIGWLS